MPNLHGAREQRQEPVRGSSQNVHSGSRAPFEPSRRDPRSPLLVSRANQNDSLPQGASATGSLTVSATNCFALEANTNRALSNPSTPPTRGGNEEMSATTTVTDPVRGVFHRRARGNRMTPIIASLETVSLEEALAYLDTAEGDELAAAFALAKDRNLLDGSDAEPDDAEVHHALFLLRRARGLDSPSFDLMRVQLKKRVAA